MSFSERASKVREWFEERGHEVFAPSGSDAFYGLSENEADALKHECKLNSDLIREHAEVIRKADKVLILNYDKNDIAGYIGGNSFLEMGFAHIFRKPVYLLNPIPEQSYCRSEILAMHPIVVEDDLSQIETR